MGMKKKLLFVIPNLSAGGGEKSLVNLLSQIDYDRYQVDLFMFDHSGLFLDLLPQEVRVLSLPESYKLFTLPLGQSLCSLLRKGQLSRSLDRLMFTLRYRYMGNVSAREQYNWKFLKNVLEPLPASYDAAIGFLEKTSTYFCVDKVKATKKIGWVHIDYDLLGMDPAFDIRYFRRLDHIITVSEECANILRIRFPSEQAKVGVIHNIVSPAVIRKMADHEDELAGPMNRQTTILSIGRLHYQKGFEMAIEACKRLVDKGYRLKWYVIGEGEERGKLTGLIQETGLGEHFILLGLRTNPYPYIKGAHIYAQTSRFEGKSIAIDEAKILQKPILVTNYSTAKDQIVDGENGIIVEMDAEAIAAGLERLIHDGNLRDRLSANLAKEKLGTEAEIHKLYALL